MHRSNWDDLRFVLAVAEAGSLSAAARRLGVNHATVLRRIAAFEDLHGGTVFDRTARGYTLPDHRREVIEALRGVEAAVLSVERLVERGSEPLAGPVKVTSTDTFCVAVLPEPLAALRARAERLSIELICSNARLDLARLDAEIAVRPSATEPEGLRGTAAARLGFAAYAAPGAPPRWLWMTGPLERSAPALWLAETTDPEARAGAADSFLTLREMAAAGQGSAILPYVLGETDPRLTRLPGVMPPMTVDVWVACHPDLADVPRIRAVRDYLADALAARAGILSGET